MTALREPAVAGQFYPSDPFALREAITACFEHSEGPGEVPKAASRSGRVAGFVVPHAAFQYSGPVAAHAFHRMAELGPPSVIVILGPNHYGVGKELALSAWDRWETPLGSVPVDSALGEKLAALVPGLAADAVAHASEHSLEVQLPFLVHLYGTQVPVLPIAMSVQSVPIARPLGESLAKVLSGRSALLLASSDFSHYLSDTQAREQDSHALQDILSIDPEGVAKTVEERGLNMCGAGPVMTMLVAMRELKATTAKLLAYGTSGDTSGDTDRVVGYAAIAVEAPARS